MAKPGPEPTLISRRQVDALYEVLLAVTGALNQLDIPYIVTGGSLLGAIRQHSILFCDDDIDLAILEEHNYERAKSQLQSILGSNYKYSVRPWEGGDKVRLKRCSNVFLDVFCIRRYSNFEDLNEVIGVKKNGESQSVDYIDGIMKTIYKSLHSQGELESLESATNHQELPCPIWHFNTRKAIELWPKEVYRDCEMYPLNKNLKMGPVLNISGPHAPVRLLKRAFGQDCFDVYYQSMSHGDSKSLIVDKDANEEKKDENNTITQYPPHISVGGQWSQSTKTPLSEEHYLPMQSKSRAKRRFSTHCKKSLFEYLEHQTHEENISLTVAGVLPRPRRTIYLDGVFDLFHIGHLKSIEQCAALGDRVIIGITGDKDAMGYKRRPIINEADRTAIVQSLKMVDHIVCPCPLLVTKDFMKKWGIDLVVHGFADKRDRDKQIDQFFNVAVEDGKFQEINYYNKMSTTDIIGRIKSDAEDDADEQTSNGTTNPKWFGATLAAATAYSSDIPFDPFPIQLRSAIESHIQKARDKQGAALNAVRAATTGQLYDEVLSDFMSEYAQEGSFSYGTKEMKLRESFLESCGLGLEFDLQRLHETAHNKDEMLFHLASDRLHFQEEYDSFVRSVCIPHLASLPRQSGKDETLEDFYYQSFPCIRIVKPGEFSIGPHGDASYGHHPCSINFYIPLTKIEGSASLFLESRPGSEDWHPIVGGYGLVKVFAGAICKHFTPENHGDFTRVSLDFRIIPGHMFHSLKCGGSQPGGVRDVYRQKEGYYSRCYKQGTQAATPVWERDGPLQVPDARYGFPWTKVIQNKK